MKNEMVDSINVDYDMNDTLLSVHRGPYKEGQYVDEGAYIIFEWEERDPEFEEIYKLLEWERKELLEIRFGYTTKNKRAEHGESSYGRKIVFEKNHIKKIVNHLIKFL
jgi:hypothetical protein